MTKNKPKYCSWCPAGCNYFSDGVAHFQDCDHYKAALGKVGQVQILQELLEEVETLSTGALDTEIGVVVDFNQVKDRINQKISSLEGKK